jgi:hypothetical protein
VSFQIDKKAKGLKTQTSMNKMKSALRKVLADLSDRNPHGCRYYIANNEIEIDKAPDPSPPHAGQSKTYRASGRFWAGVCHKGGRMTKDLLSFSITFKDIIDERGLPDVEYVDPTTIDVLPKKTATALSGQR